MNSCWSSRIVAVVVLSTGIFWSCSTILAAEFPVQPASHCDGYTAACYEQRIQSLERAICELRSGCATNLEGEPEYEISTDCCPGWVAGIDYLNWQVDRNDLAFAIFDPVGQGVPRSGQPVRSLDYGPQGGLRISFGRQMVANWEMNFRYTHLRTDDSQTFAPGGGRVLAVLSSPATGLTNANSVTATSEFRYDVFDLELGHRFDASDTLSVRYYSGVRFGSIDQRLQARYNGGAFVNGLVDVPTNVNTFGARIGSLLQCHFSDSLTFFANGSIALSTAEINASRREVNAAAVTINANRSSDVLAPGIEIALGTRYQVGSWNFSAGYEWTNWFNIVSPLEFTDSFNGGTLATAQRDLGLHGLFVNATFEF